MPAARGCDLPCTCIYENMGKRATRLPAPLIKGALRPDFRNPGKKKQEKMGKRATRLPAPGLSKGI